MIMPYSLLTDLSRGMSLAISMNSDGLYDYVTALRIITLTLILTSTR